MSHWSLRGVASHRLAHFVLGLLVKLSYLFFDPLNTLLKDLRFLLEIFVLLRAELVEIDLMLAQFLERGFIVAYYRLVNLIFLLVVI